MTGIVSARFVDYLVAQHFEGGRGIHGVNHWRRVEANGLMLGEELGADLDVIRCFAWLHDARRENNYEDPGHGRRGGALARELNEEFMGLEAARLEVLVAACDGHTGGHRHGDVTVCCCWDADRLDLCRLGYTINGKYLLTELAREQRMIERVQARLHEIPEEW